MGGYYPDFIRSDFNQGWLLKMGISLRISAGGTKRSQWPSPLLFYFIFCIVYKKNGYKNKRVKM